jgi:hypothetical protein
MTKPTALPSPLAFRAWLISALKSLALSPYTLADELGLGRNTIAAFIANEKSDIRLGTARMIQARLSRLTTTAIREGSKNGGV